MQKIKLDKKTIIQLSFYGFLILDAVLIIPLQLKGANSAYARIGDLREKMSQYNQEIASHKDLVEQKQGLSRKMTELKGRIISRQDIATVSVYISHQAKESGIEVLEILPQKLEVHKEISKETFSYLPIKIESIGSYHNLARFVNALEEGRYFLDIKKIIVKGGNPLHRISLTVQAIVKE